MEIPYEELPRQLQAKVPFYKLPKEEQDRINSKLIEIRKHNTLMDWMYKGSKGCEEYKHI